MPDRPLRVLLVATSLHAGAGMYLHRVLQGLPPGQVQVVVACAPGAALDAPVAALAPVVAMPWGRHGSVAGVWLGLIRLVRLIRGGDFDLVVTHSSLAGGIGRLAARLAGGVPVLHTVHGWACGTRTASAPVRWGLRLCERILATRTAWAVACSRQVLAQGLAQGLARPGRASAIAYDLDPQPAFDRQGIRAELGIPEAAPVALFVGRLEPQKGVMVLLEAWRAVVAQLPGAVLLLAGEGRQRPLVEAAVAALPAGAVRCLGWRGDAPRLLAACDAFVLPSFFEGLPITVLEAMAAARPVVATAVDGTPEAVVDGVTGRLVPSGDAVALAAAVTAVLGDAGLAAAYGRAGLQRLQQRFPTGRCAEQHLRLFRALTAGIRTRRRSPAPRASC